VLKQYKIAEKHLNIISNPLGNPDIKKQAEEMTALWTRLNEMEAALKALTSGEYEITTKD
jgi:hypothetical protein